MASVSSLDQDMRKLRLDRYTPQAADEVRSWIETTLCERIPQGDLLDALKDGVALCKLANLVLPPPGIRYKASSMPFTQRENISQFLTACELSPLNLHAHDRFLTVDLYDNKDPAQVLQCIGAFSRAANAVKPAIFKSAIGPRQGGASSPTRKMFDGQVGRARNDSTASQTSSTTFARALSPALTGGSNTPGSTRTPNAPVSSWSKRTDEMTSAPAWNIHQYGYMGGASQGNQGVSFGARRQITSPNVMVPSLAEKERIRKEKEAEAERQRLEEEQIQKRRQQERDDEARLERARQEELREEQARVAREKERQAVEDERRRWDEEERRWKEEEERRKKMDEAMLKEVRPGLNGQYLSQYQAEQAKAEASKSSESERIQELERQLEEAKERERQYQLERQQRAEQPDRSELSTPETPEAANSYRRPETAAQTTPSQRDSWAPDERSQLRQACASNQSPPAAAPSPANAPKTPSRPLPVPETSKASATAPDTRPLPEPATSRNTYSTPTSSPFTRTDRFLSRNAAPVSPQPRTHFPQELGMTPESERAAEDARRAASQQKTKAGGWASKSLLEREMERERERQREWELAQAEKMGKSPLGPRELRR